MTAVQIFIQVLVAKQVHMTSTVVENININFAKQAEQIQLLSMVDVSIATRALLRLFAVTELSKSCYSSLT